jgi:hypothetical protein
MKTSHSKVPNPIKVTVEGGLKEDSAIQLTISSFATVEEWIETFKTILVHQGFDFRSISQIFDEPDCHCEESQENSGDDSDYSQYLREKSEF